MTELTFTPNFRPVNISVDEIQLRLRAVTPVRVILEPGDATRYELVLVPQSGSPKDTVTGNSPLHLIVVRAIGGSTLSAVVIQMYKGEYWPGQFAPISNNNEHTQNVLAEFFGFLMKAIL